MTAWKYDNMTDSWLCMNQNITDIFPALSTRMIERIFCGAVTRGSAQKEGRMSYTEFVWFLLSEEVKTSILKWPFNSPFPGQTTSNSNWVLVPLHGPWWRWTSLHVSATFEHQLNLLEQISSCLSSGTNLSISMKSSCNEWNSLASKLFPSTTASAR